MVFNIETSTVSLNFHIQHNDLFEIIIQIDGNPPTLSHWKLLYLFNKYMLYNVQTVEGGSGANLAITDHVQQ